MTHMFGHSNSQECIRQATNNAKNNQYCLINHYQLLPILIEGIIFSPYSGAPPQSH